MPIKFHQPITYLITAGTMTGDDTPTTEEFARTLALVERGVSAGVTLAQLREKDLSARSLYQLTLRAAQITRGSATRLLVNDRSDIARAAGADGVHLTTQSLDAGVVRRTYGKDFLVGVSTHSLVEAQAARAGGADFATFGPVFDTPSKRGYGRPLGTRSLAEAARFLAPFPLLALGGVTLENAREVFQAGAQGVAAIRLFGDAQNFNEIIDAIKNAATEIT
ncbi:MAG TPA: thiamine phosphate synthase [Pyrinomonadaceae bacterium]|nr:thiamine phosphate synthase [Pyrinomonadaceae bacterium]